MRAPGCLKSLSLPLPFDGPDYSCDKSSPTILKTVVFGEVALPPPVRPGHRTAVQTDSCETLETTGESAAADVAR